MEILFELFSNPIALFILIGVISSLFNKKKSDGQPPQRRPVRPPGPMQQQQPGPARQPRPAPASRQPAEARVEPWQEIEVNPIPRYDTGRDTQRSRGSAKHDPGETGVEIINDLQKVYLERKLQSEEQMNKQSSSKGRMSAGESSGRLKQKREHKEPEVVFQPDRDTLIEGLIWAEVLGKPRAKRPYNPLRRY
ncbi:hypothetical protein [Mesobacillus selenatarsenatis]|uniref:Uncharacterized protein n=1 Tax=Mesobacillus selenatarsenatis (strain DSM 18680 / JCM 14380 / FERM P-15431 / SF-1) TaxID=1321606 RepID=A0A0A8XAL7_MESS1|nr:hypothetical protein [Mesobacillus selenatarsenatis]GAM15221.1 hypothetical protein SAMD00020551_3377 [Mesobacillus selenatarsenatis SF-1]